MQFSGKIFLSEPLPHTDTHTLKNLFHRDINFQENMKIYRRHPTMLFEELLNKFPNKTNKLTVTPHPPPPIPHRTEKWCAPYRLPKLTCKTFRKRYVSYFQYYKIILRFNLVFPTISETFYRG